MPRQKLSEFRAKSIISNSLDLPYIGWSIQADKSLDQQLNSVASVNGKFVVKVDEGVKGRFKKGLVLLDVDRLSLKQAVDSLAAKGYKSFLIEPQLEHQLNDERYISLVQERDGIYINYTSNGGVDVENQTDTMVTLNYNNASDDEFSQVAAVTGFEIQKFKKLIKNFEDNYFVFLEINPYLLQDSELKILDAAVEVDDAATYFAEKWRPIDFRNHSNHALTDEEKTVLELNSKSPAAFNLSLLNPNGSIFLLLSGGGASIVAADEVYNQGFGKQLANYGEYSGNPNSEETYVYTKAVLSLLVKSSAPRKVLFIGGAVANFTDIAQTFTGVMKAIEEVVELLKSQKVKIYVRRGGPNQETGLAKMEALLAHHNLLGAVHNPETPLTEAVDEALQEVKHG
ncbi:MAG TPA: ATP citrate lyase citrate-binding domain-containing protein [Candidatus Saccharimonadales bacterium]|nr:ATP citrate lyase citrate-binding domain-containing protein [Candidatus Saccharimonadales bacterium]